MMLLLSEWLTLFNDGFTVIQYITLRSIFAALTSLVVCLVFGPVMIRWLQAASIGQSVRDDGPSSHLSKAGTPTMGGAMILVAVSISVLLWSDLSVHYVWVVLFVFFWQSVVAFAAALFIYMTARSTAEVSLLIPYVKDVSIYLGLFFVPFAFFVIVGTSNAVNLTDGLDGLAIMPTVMVAAALGLFAYVTGNAVFSKYLGIPGITGVGELTVFCSSLVGAGLGFLWFNTYPAQVFMGDVGALALGAALGVIAVLVRQEVVLFIMGGVFVMETVSVKGWPEPRVIVRFWIITFILVLVGLASLKIR